MAIHFRCPCGAVLNAPNNSTLKAGECPTCGKVVVVPKGAVAVLQVPRLTPSAGYPAVRTTPAPVGSTAAKTTASTVLKVAAPAQGIASVAEPDLEPAVAELDSDLGEKDTATDLVRVEPPPRSRLRRAQAPAPPPVEEAEELDEAEDVNDAAALAEAEDDEQDEDIAVAEVEEDFDEDTAADLEAVNDVDDGMDEDVAEEDDMASEALEPDDDMVEEEAKPQRPARAGKTGAVGRGGEMRSKRAGRSGGRSGRPRRGVKMQKCGSCGEQVMVGARKCPECGEPVTAKGGSGMKIVIGLVVLIVLAVGGIAGAYYMDMLPAGLKGTIDGMMGKTPAKPKAGTDKATEKAGDEALDTAAEDESIGEEDESAGPASAREIDLGTDGFDVDVPAIEFESPTAPPKDSAYKEDIEL
jgi:rRNA maturation protein Nop10